MGCPLQGTLPQPLCPVRQKWEKGWGRSLRAGRLSIRKGSQRGVWAAGPSPGGRIPTWVKTQAQPLLIHRITPAYLGPPN